MTDKQTPLQAQLAPSGNRPDLLSNFEFGMIVTWNAFSRWVTRCMSAAGGEELTLMDAILLHHICHRGRRMKLADLCFSLDITDSHIAAYALRKLASMNLAATEKLGKETLYYATEKGEALINRFKTIRMSCLMPGIDDSLSGELGQVELILRRLSGQYDQAARGVSLHQPPSP